MSTNETLDLAALLAEFNDGDDEHDDLELVQEGDWINEGKYQYMTNVYKHKPTGRFVAIHSNRSGSHWTDWDYGDDDINEVVQVTKTVMVYEAVKA